MTRYTYIKNNIGNGFVEFPERMNTSLYNNIGVTYDDYLKGKWVLLNSNQVNYKKQHPGASVQEVWNMGADSEEETISSAIGKLLNKISTYDKSDNVNAFLINGEKAWIDAQQRASYKNSLDSVKLLGVNAVQVIINGNTYSISTEDAERCLAMIQYYADQCYIVTETHKNEVRQLDNLDAIRNYDYTVGYPKMLNFEL